jgi:hypothetical protein
VKDFIRNVLTVKLPGIVKKQRVEWDNANGDSFLFQ